MLEILVPKGEYYNDTTGVFFYSKECTLQLEHSLVSISKWESKWRKPFLGKEPQTTEQTIDYIRCMTLTKNVDPNCYMAITDDNIREVRDYIALPMTAIKFSKDDKKGNNEIITSEIIYYDMITLNIPFECQKWHLNRLINLIQVCSIKNSPPKKMTPRELMERNKKLNDSRRQALKSNG